MIFFQSLRILIRRVLGVYLKFRYNTGVKQFRIFAIVFGCIITVIVLGLNAFGAFHSFEDWTIDLRFRYGRWEIEDPGQQIALVAIDDPSLDTIGRWPWKRSLLAQATDEMARAGATTIAYDILFTEPEEGTTGDQLLANALRQSNAVIALSTREESPLNADWETPVGQAQLAAFTTAVEAGIDRDINVIIAQAGLNDFYKSKVLQRPGAMKGLAAWLSLERLRDQGKLPKTQKAFNILMLGGSIHENNLGEISERTTLEGVWKRGESWRAVESKFVADATSKGTPQDMPPILLIAQAAKAVGVSSAENDGFGDKLRRISPYFPSDYGLVPQFGLAAALTFQGQTVKDAVLGERQLQLNEFAIPIRDGKVLVDWGTQLLPGYGTTQGRNATVGMGRLIEQARERAKLEKQNARLRELGMQIAFPEQTKPDQANPISKTGEKVLDASPLGKTPEWFEKTSLQEIKTEFEELWSLYKDNVDDPDLTQAEVQLVAGLKEWLMAEEAMQEGTAALASGDKELRNILGGKLVFVGFTATGAMADVIPTIFGSRTPGVLVHIAMADMVLNKRALEFAPDWIGIVALIVLGLVSTLTAARFGAGIGACVVFFVLSAYVGMLGVVAFDQGEWIFPMAAPVTSGLGAWIVTTVAVAVITQREKQRVTRQFRARVSPELVEMLAKDPNALSMGGVEREATILFGDLAGFTSISEVLGGPAVVSTLNLYMGAMTKELTERRAYVNKFLGDGILAFWSAFGEEPEQGRLSIEAALACQKAVNEIGKRPDRQGLPLVSLRLGMATGKVVIGDCGAPPDLNDYTMIGDSGNLAARLESANKQFGSAILIDGRTAELSKGSGLALLSLGRVVVVGQTIPIDVFEVCLEDDPTSRIEVTETMVRLFTARKFDECRASLANLQKTLPGSKKLVHAFMDALDNPEDLRDGVLRLRAK